MKIPRNKDADYTAEIAAERRRFATEHTGAALEHVGGFTFDPTVLPGNIESFIGVAQNRVDFPLQTTVVLIVSSFPVGVSFPVAD